MAKAAPKSLRMTHGLVKSQVEAPSEGTQVSIPRISRMVSMRHLSKESRMFTTQTGGKGCAGVGVTVTGRMCDVHVPWPAVHGGSVAVT